ncbi:unnamed protein product, partial [Mesorhabditis spiculigera]
MLAVLLLAVIWGIVAYYRWVRQFPPGPFPWPIIGNLPQLAISQYPHKTIEAIGRPYGPVFTVFLPLPVIVITGYDEHKEALLGPKADNFSSRPDNPSDSLFMNVPNGGIIFSEGAEWTEQRTFTLQCLRLFGVGSRMMEAKILSSVQILFDHLDTLPSSNIDINWPLHLCVGNVVHEIYSANLFPHQQSQELKHYQDRIDLAMQMVRSRASVLIVQALPWTRHLPLIGKWGYHELRGIAEELIGYVEKQIEQSGDEPSFVNQYKQEMTRKGLSASFTYDNLVNTVTDLWLAGMETAATTIRWAIVLLTAHPDVQERLGDEMRRVAGDRMISIGDKAQMPYAQAVICEIHRMANVVTFNVFHKTYRDDRLGKHFIPAGSTVLPQISAVLASEELFENPDQFNPERFIKRTKEGGIELRKDRMEKVIAFSLGKRQCAGEALARME